MTIELQPGAAAADLHNAVQAIEIDRGQVVGRYGRGPG